MKKWKPFNSAPKTGEEIMVWRICDNDEKDGEVVLVRWDEKFEEWLDSSTLEESYSLDELSHWMPLPDGPNVE